MTEYELDVLVTLMIMIIKHAIAVHEKFIFTLFYRSGII